LLFTAAVTAVEVGDDPAALSARQRLAPLLDGIDDPFLRASCQLALAWTSTIAGDLDGALREASASLADSAARTSPSGPRRPAHRPAPWRRPSAATTTPFII
jgi:hypothetical protein